MDIIDLKLLRQLQKNNRLATDVLGEKIGLSATACQRRLKKLRATKVISKEVAVLNASHLDSYVTILVDVEIKQGSADHVERFKQRMLKSRHVQQCYYTTGPIDFILIVTAKNMLAYEHLTQELFFKDDNIKKFQSTVVMENVKVGLELPI